MAPVAAPILKCVPDWRCYYVLHVFATILSVLATGLAVKGFQLEWEYTWGVLLVRVVLFSFSDWGLSCLIAPPVYSNCLPTQLSIISLYVVFVITQYVMVLICCAHEVDNTKIIAKLSHNIK